MPCDITSSATPQATGRFLTDYEGLELVSSWDKISIQFYKVATRKRALGAFVPHTIVIMPLGANGPLVVWPPQRRPAPRHARRLAGAALGALPALFDGAPEELDDESEDDDIPPLQPEGDFDLDGGLAELLEEAEVLLSQGVCGPLPADVDEHGEPAASASVAPPAPQEHAPPPPALAAPAAAPGEGARGGRARRSAAATCHVIGGSVSFYHSKMSFEAVCDNRLHGRCVATRGVRPQGLVDGVPRAGRPVGFLAAWLEAGESAATKADHWRLFDQPLARRQELRAEIGRTEAGAVLLRCERERVEGEPEEPVSISGYMA